MTTDKQLIIKQARKLGQLEKEFLKRNFGSGKPESDKRDFAMELSRIAVEAFSIRNDIVSDPEYYQETTLKVPRDVEVILKKIRENDKFYSISYYEGLAKEYNYLIEILEKGEEKVPTSLEDYLKNSDYWQDWLNDFIPDSYYRAKIKIGPIIASFHHIPDNIQQYFNEIRETFAFGFYRSSVALCRSLVEMALYDKLSRKGIFQNRNTKVVNIDIAKEDNLYRYINLAKRERILEREKAELAHNIRKSANDILHLKEDTQKVEPTLSEENTFKTIFDTINVIECLYK